MAVRPRRVAVLCGFLLVGTAHAGAPLTFEERAAAQTAIERVYHQHRAGEARTFAQAVPRHVLEQAVMRLAIQSAILENRGVAVTPAMLNEELDRIRRQTQRPEQLEEIFAALQGDPVLIEEALVRPLVAERLLRAYYEAEGSGTFEDWVRSLAPADAVPRLRTIAQPDLTSLRVTTALATCAAGAWVPSSALQFFGGAGTVAVWTGSEAIFYDGAGGVRYNPITQSWRPISLADGPSPRYEPQAVWTGTEMVVWGGHTPGGAGYFGMNSGGRYDPSTDTWRPLPPAPSPMRGVWGHSMVWTGSEVIVFGGKSSDVEASSVSVGARYNPSTDTWSSVVSYGSGRRSHAAVWTGSRMIVYGGVRWNGFSATPYQDGARYDPAMNTWSAIPVGPAASSSDRALWTGAVMVFWSAGSTGAGRYSPATNTWSPVAVGGPAHSFEQRLAWTGTRVLVWPGGGLYDPAGDSWSTMSSAGAPAQAQNSVWAGGRFLVYNGAGTLGSSYEPAGNAWSSFAPESPPSGPSARVDHASVWTGSEMIVWGGSSTLGSVIDRIPWRYSLVLDAWTAGSSAGAPAPFPTTAVWTGSEMVLWDDTNLVGAAYAPAANSWRPLPTAGAPGARTGAAHVWTGSEMIVWGGTSGGNSLTTGARYRPGTNSWVSMSSAGAPTTSPPGVWTGSALVAWNGPGTGGGRYDPGTDAWSPIASTGAPVTRQHHTLVWTGSRLLVWGGLDPAGIVISPASGGAYAPSTDTWSPLPTAGQPQGRADVSGVAAPNGDLLVWSGWGVQQGSVRVVLNDGAKEASDAGLWYGMDLVHGPSGRYSHSTVSTGAEMIVWGGTNLSGVQLRNGGIHRFTPVPDGDGDGRLDCADDCPQTPNPGQEDADGDGLGDACDPCMHDAANDAEGDGICADVDVCPTEFDPNQPDTDADGQGDRCDPDDGLIYLFRTDPHYIEWAPDQGQTTWNVYEGDLGVLRSNGTYTQTQTCDVPFPELLDTEVPLPSRVSFSLVTATVTGGETGLGEDSQGVTRPNTLPCH